MSAMQQLYQMFATLCNRFPSSQLLISSSSLITTQQLSQCCIILGLVIAVLHLQVPIFVLFGITLDAIPNPGISAYDNSSYFFSKPSQCRHLPRGDLGLKVLCNLDLRQTLGSWIPLPPDSKSVKTQRIIYGRVLMARPGVAHISSVTFHRPEPSHVHIQCNGG